MGFENKTKGFVLEMIFTHMGILVWDELVIDSGFIT